VINTQLEARTLISILDTLRQLEKFVNVSGFADYDIVTSYTSEVSTDGTSYYVLRTTFLPPKPSRSRRSSDRTKNERRST
jgi:hypothetical protein